MIQIVQKIWLIGMLAYFSHRDVQTRKLPVKMIALFLIMGIPAWIGRMAEDGGMAGASLLPGILFGLISLISQGGLGMGDAWIVLGMGLYLSWEEMIVFLVLSMFLGMIWAGKLFLKKRDGKQTLPLLPFLLAGYIGGMYFWNI